MAYELIETIEVGAGGASSIEFTSIPQDGVDLWVVFSLRHTSVGLSANLALNGDTTNANYPNIRLTGNGSSASSASASTRGLVRTNYSGTTSNTFSSFELYISNYISSADKSMSVNSVTEDNATTAYQDIMAWKYSTSSAITSLEVTTSASFEQYSTASLYKIY